MPVSSVSGALVQAAGEEFGFNGGPEECCLDKVFGGPLNLQNAKTLSWISMSALPATEDRRHSNSNGLHTDG